MEKRGTFVCLTATSERRARWVLWYFMRCVIILISFTAGAMAEPAPAGLRGRIKNASGVSAVSMRISLQSLDARYSRSALTDKNGDYNFTDLPPGRYKIWLASQRPDPSAISISLASGEERVLDLTYPFSSRAASTTSNPAAAKSNVEEINSKTLRDLPVSGRDVTQAATLAAGVSSVRTQQTASDTNSGRGQRGFGAQISVSGARPQQNNYLLDGISLNDYANSAPGSVLGLDLGADAVEQFKVVTSSYPAEYGRSSGGVINAVTRSGSDGFHAALYEFFRNSALDARNYFDQEKPPFRRNQFGASAGGPIRRDKTFIFGNYEGLRQSLGMTSVDTVPSEAARQGLLAAGPIPVSAAVRPYMALYPLPNSGLLPGGDTGIFRFSGQQITGENYFTTRVDHKLTTADSLSGTYAIDLARTLQPDALDTKFSAVQTRRQVLSVSDTHTFNPDLLTTWHAGLNRVVALVGQTPAAINPLAADPSLGFVPGLPAGKMSIVGLTSFTGGLGALSAFDFHWTSLQFYQNTTLHHGSHSLSMGASVERMRDNMLSSTDPNGSYTFNSLTDFLLNRPFAVTVVLPGAITPRNLRQTVVASYLEDNVQMSTNFTVDLGLRYEAATVPNEVNGKLSSLQRLQDTQPHLGNPYFHNPTLRNFEPRVGLAWNPAAAGKAVVRAGFGIFDVLPLPYEFELLSSFASPFYQIATPANLPAGSFPSAAVTFAKSDASSRRNVFVEPDPRRNYVMQWNLGLELQPARTVSLLLAYVGSRGVHQPFRVDDANLVLPTLTANGYLWPSPAGGGERMNPSVGRLDGLFWRGDSYYDALQTHLGISIIHGLQVQTSYTWGKSIDTGSSTVAGDQFSNSISSLPWFDLRLNRGLSDFNIAQTLSLNFTWTLPGAHIQAGRLTGLAKGWSMGGTFQQSTGAPFTLLMGGDPLGEKSTDPSDVPDLLSRPGCSKPVQDPHSASYIQAGCFAPPNPLVLRGNLGRNSLTGPGLSNLDLFIHKDNFIHHGSEPFNIQVRLELFNAFNHTNFAPPLDHTHLFDAAGNLIPGAGLINATQTPSRQVQLGLKLIW